MSESKRISDDFWPLLDAVCDSDLADSQVDELAALLNSDPAALELFLDHIHLRRNIQSVCRAEKTRNLGLARIQTKLPHARPASPPPIVINATPVSVNYFPQGMPFAYLVACAVVGVGLLIASLIHVSYPGMLVRDRGATRAVPVVGSRDTANMVGRITGMADCRWVDALTAADLGAHVPIGRRYALSSGLLEITYDTGARVLLQGPVTYEVESPAGGYLSIGKLTAKLEKRSEVRGQKSESTNQKSEIPNNQFAVRTPTAVVTDLGTEFGVEVNENGNTTSHVFRGSVRVESLSHVMGAKTGAIILRENESICVEEDEQWGHSEATIRRVPVDPGSFVRQMVQTSRSLDLLDIVAGGNGMGHGREHGIDPTTGLEDSVFVAESRGGAATYHRVSWKNAVIDGVFVPNGEAGPIAVDSAGHTFGGFPRTSGELFGSIWARAADVKPHQYADDSRHWVYCMGRGDPWMPANRGLLAIHPNAGITFNLAVMRNLVPGAWPARFRAVAGMADAHKFDPNGLGLADLWIIVDGRLKQKQTQFRPQDGAIPLSVDLGPTDQFLTLATTDGGNGYFCDWVVFGDPVLEMSPIEAVPQRSAVQPHDSRNGR